MNGTIFASFASSSLRWWSFLLLTCITASAASPKVTTVAGGYVGGGKLATLASLALPTAVARDAKGNIYVSDTENCRIRKISGAGIITNYAGTGICGYNGDGGRASAAMISRPYGIAFDSQGDLLVADQGNNRIRKITPAGIITTVAGNGTFGYTGDNGPAVDASMEGPISVAVGGGGIYIADFWNYVIRMIDIAGNIHTVAGNHTQGFSGDGGPATSAQIGYTYGVAADSNGNFYITDVNSGRVRRVDSSGTITTYAGNGKTGNTGSGGPATSAGIGGTWSLLVSGGQLYVGTTTNIWAVSLSTQIINLIAGDSNGAGGFNGDGNVALSTLLFYPIGMTSDGAGGLVFADSSNDRVRQIAASTQIVTTIGGGYLGDGGRATTASLNFGYALPNGHIALDPAGNLYIADTANNRIRKVTPGGIITTFAGTGMTGYTGDGGRATDATLSGPTAVVADGRGNVFIGDRGNLAIRKVDNNGTITTFLSMTSGPVADTSALAMGPDGNLYAVFDDMSTVWKITPSGSATIVAGVLYRLGYNGDGIPATQAELALPEGVALDSAGNLYIADLLNNRIRKVDTNGIIWTVAGNGNSGFSGDGGLATSAMIYFPEDVAVDVAGNLYIADSGNGRVRVLDLSGTINTYAGTGTAGYNGNNLAATKANLVPTGLVTSSKGVLYVSDSDSCRVRKIH